MTRFRHESRLEAAPGRVWEWHASPGALERLLPPWRDVRLLSREPELRDGARVELELGVGPLRTRWVTVHRDVVPGRGFADEQIQGPFRRWLHAHRFDPAEDGGTRLIDEVDYALPLPPLGPALAGALARGELERTFRWRHRRTARDLARHLGRPEGEPLRIAITGASGMIGSALSAFLRAGGHRVDPLVRRRPRPGSGEIEWAPREGRLDAAALEGVDAVVHLAGENLYALGWSEEKKRRIRRSRVEGTDLLARSIAGLERKPHVLVSASGVSYYGDRGDEPLEEDSAPGEGFLAGVCRDWEAATRPAEQAGVRVVRLRIGPVLTPRGGALAKMLPAFRAGLGGRVGSGEGWMSWIGLDDLVGVIHRALYDPGLRGAVNAVAPRPVTQAELVRTLADVLERPAVFRVSESLLRIAGGQMAEEAVLASVRAHPARLEEAGFRFFTPDLRSALEWELGRLPEEGVE